MGKRCDPFGAFVYELAILCRRSILIDWDMAASQTPRRLEMVHQYDSNDYNHTGFIFLGIRSSSVN